MDLIGPLNKNQKQIPLWQRNIPPNKRKIRGWKRRVRFLHNWGKWIYEPDLENWNSGSDYTYERYRESPWYTFYGKRHPPLWFFKEIIKQYVSAFQNWVNIFQEKNEPYDLQLELHDPNYIFSEIEARRTEQVGQRIYYWPLSEVQRHFPHEKFASKESLTELDWELCIEEDYIFENDIEWRGKTKEALLSEGYVKRETMKEQYILQKEQEMFGQAGN